MDKRYFSKKIVKWYLDNCRPLPWRQTNDPYHIWLSEVILQQTRVAQGLPYYQRFLASYPNIHRLAQADEQQVLRHWQGLGYYTRARNLHKCARTVVDIHGGKFPLTSAALETLPGVGSYTAAAIASFSYGEKIAVVDGNVFRVLSRIFGIDIPTNSPEGKRTFTRLANELISEEQPGLHNQAVMEFGATFCTPVNPHCEQCPFSQSCIASKQGLIKMLPVKAPKKQSRRRYFYYLVVEKDGTLLMKKRAEKDIWHGLFDFLLIEKSRRTKPQRVIADSPFKKWFTGSCNVLISKSYQHILTHQTIHCRFIHVEANPAWVAKAQDFSFYSLSEVAELPKPTLITRYLEEQNKL